MACEKVFDTKDLTHDEWLAKRRELGIGGSEMAAILGYNKWTSILDVWLEKRGELEPKEQNEYMYWGNVLEDVVAREFEIRTGKKVRRNNFMLRSVEHPYLFADIDREIVGEDAGLECKTSSSFNKEQWEGDNVPDNYYIQCQHYMAVTGKQSWWIACLLGGNTYIYKEIPRNEDVIRAIIEEGGKFWRMVQEGIMPAVDGSKKCEEALQHVYDDVDEHLIELPSIAESYIGQYREATEQAEKWKTEQQLAKNKLCKLLGQSQEGYIGEHTVVWKHTKGRQTFDKKAFEADYPDLAARYMKQGQPTRNYFRIK